MVHRFLNLTLKSKLILLFVVIAVFPIIFLFITFSTRSTKLTLQNSADNTEMLLCQINSNLTSKINTVNSTTLNFIINKQLKNLLIEDEEVLEDINRESIISILRSTVISNPSISNMVLYGKNNRFYYFGGYLSEDFYNGLEKYCIDDQFRGENVWIGRQNDILCRSTQQTQEEVFTSVSIMKDFINNEKLGYVIVNLKTQTIDDVLKNIYTEPAEKLLIVIKSYFQVLMIWTLKYMNKILKIILISPKIPVFMLKKAIGGMFKLLIIEMRKQTGISFRGYRCHL